MTTAFNPARMPIFAADDDPPNAHSQSSKALAAAAAVDSNSSALERAGHDVDVDESEWFNEDSIITNGLGDDSESGDDDNEEDDAHVNGLETDSSQNGKVNGVHETADSPTSLEDTSEAFFSQKASEVLQEAPSVEQDLEASDEEPAEPLLSLKPNPPSSDDHTSLPEGTFFDQMTSVDSEKEPPSVDDAADIFGGQDLSATSFFDQADDLGAALEPATPLVEQPDPFSGDMQGDDSFFNQPPSMDNDEGLWDPPSQSPPDVGTHESLFTDAQTTYFHHTLKDANSGQAGDDDFFGAIHEQTPVPKQVHAMDDFLESVHETAPSIDAPGTAAVGADSQVAANGGDQDWASKWQDALGEEEFLPDDGEGFLSDDEETGQVDEFLAKPQSLETQLPQGIGLGISPVQATFPASTVQSSGAGYAPVHASQQTSYTPSQSAPSPYLPQSTPLMSPFALAVQQQQHPSSQPPLRSAESFTAKGKGGYHSPYDLPDDLGPRISRRRAPAPIVAPGPTSPFPGAVQPTPPMGQALPRPTPGPPSPIPPPQRQASLGASAYTPLQTPSGALSPYTRPPSVPTGPAVAATPPNIPKQSLRQTRSTFFEDLPTVAKARPASSGRYTPSSLSGQFPPPRSASYSAQPVTMPHQQPAPPALAQAPSFQAPPLASRPPYRAAPYQAPPLQQSVSSLNSLPVLQEDVRVPPVSQENFGLVRPPPVQAFSNPSSAPPYTPPHPAPPPPAAGRYTPSHVSAGQPPVDSHPPRRAQTSSPSAAYRPVESTPAEPAPRPSSALSKVTSASVYAPVDRRTSMPAAAAPYQQPYYNVQAAEPMHIRKLAEVRKFEPTASSQKYPDPLERWKGSPIFCWGTGGSTVTMLPIVSQRFTSTETLWHASVGVIKVRAAKDFAPSLLLEMSSESLKFPGPLWGTRSAMKSKKKELLAWMDQRISILSDAMQFDVKREENLLLWKIMRLAVDKDGILDGPGSEDVTNAVKDLLLGKTSEPGSSIPSAGVAAEPNNPAAVTAINSLLLQGKRDEAVWQAVEHRMWAHGMLIASTSSPEIWRQVVLEFVRQEVKTLGDGNSTAAAPLAMLYRVFAGNADDAMDELVSPLLLQTAHSAGGRNPLEGLERWREALVLLLMNKSNSNKEAILKLGRLLCQHGRVEAGHICLLFAQPMALFSGFDDTDPDPDISLIGVSRKDFTASPSSAYTNIDAIRLSEIYELVVVLSSSAASANSNPLPFPHLLAFKLAHAMILADNGYRAMAKDYIESISSSIKLFPGLSGRSQPGRSPYLHPLFLDKFEKCQERITQAPKDTSSGGGWLSSSKISGKVLSSFNKFVSGEDDETGSNGGHDSGTEGPFAKLGTPNLSRAQSAVDMQLGTVGAPGYGQAMPHAPYNNGTAGYGAAISPGSTYKNSKYAPRASFESQGGRPSTESVHALGDVSSPGYGGYEPVSQPNQYLPQQQPVVPQSYGYQPSHSQTPTESPPPTHQQPPMQSLYQSPPMQPYQNPTPPAESSFAAADENTSYSPYEPPVYTPYEPDDEEGGKPSIEDDEPKRPRRKMAYDLSDDDEPIAKSKPATQAPVAEAKKPVADSKLADAKDAKAAATQKAGWFSGWFKKDPNAPPGPVRANLGESQMSFVYDPDQKRWVNKNASADTPAPAAPPPPPRSRPATATGLPASTSGQSFPPQPRPTPPPHSASALGLVPPNPPFAPHSGGITPPSAPSTPRSAAGTPPLPTPTSSGTPPPPPPGTSPTPPMPTVGAPPPRPSSLRHVDSIDDLLGDTLMQPGGRKGTAKGKRRARGYIDVMNSSAS